MSAPLGPLSPALLNSPGRAQALRVFLLFVLVMLMLVPVLFMALLVSERRSHRDEAATEIAAKWGQQQTITGPALVVPWKEHWSTTDAKGVTTDHEAMRQVVILPESLHVTAKLTTETRRRGIYGVPVYRLDARLDGRFERPDLAKLGVKPEEIDWSRAVLALGVSDARAILEQVTVDWNGRRVEFEPGIGEAAELTDDAHPGYGRGAPLPAEPGGGIHATLGLTGEPWAQTFSVPLRLNGSKGVYFTPFGKQTIVEVSGAWTDPSFQGKWLPAARTVGPSGFRATWSIPSIGRNFPQVWKGDIDPAGTIKASSFGLDLVPEIDAYRLCERTLKYALLFFVLTFTAFWLLEVMSGRALHPIQYLLIGAALCLFLLLELSLSEHLGFGVSYALASAAVVGLIVHYASAVLARPWHAWLVGGGLALLYAFHFVVLRNEDYALLLGSLLFFGALAAVMSLTRRIDWYGAGGAPGPKA
jgi:inner membrane protein